ncbi:phosphatase PAP2 family protein [Bauldia litoralis]|uniref:Undecaprenyl-diphosphatase n=1 Tax=Bauldia litoralis TaxID=665467 RepID=A0A1G6EHK3_9HYPH|nr:phosphatase PAP2 family protein [Bauldia litoralis]SDB56897.1 undecaprenyl-diphosphatase [Bauldia litoralis]
MAAEWPILVTLLLPAACIWAFVALADEVIEGETSTIDSAILLALRNPADLADPLGPKWLEEMMRDFTALGGVGVLTLIIIGTAVYLLLIRKRRAALAMTVAVAGGMLASSLLKLGFSRPRPELVPHEAFVYTTSFPSGHSMMSAVVYLTLAVMVARVQTDWHARVFVLAAAVFVCLLVGVSRVYLGVHWPTDVLAGWALGSAWAIGCWAVVLVLQRRGEIEAPGETDPAPVN